MTEESKKEKALNPSPLSGERKKVLKPSDEMKLNEDYSHHLFIVSNDAHHWFQFQFDDLLLFCFKFLNFGSSVEDDSFIIQLASLFGSGQSSTYRCSL